MLLQHIVLYLISLSNGLLQFLLSSPRLETRWQKLSVHELILRQISRHQIGTSYTLDMALKSHILAQKYGFSISIKILLCKRGLPLAPYSTYLGFISLVKIHIYTHFFFSGFFSQIILHVPHFTHSVHHTIHQATRRSNLVEAAQVQ